MNELPDRVMFDNDALNQLQRNDELRYLVSKSTIESYTSAFQYNEFVLTVEDGDLPPDREEKILEAIDRVIDETDLETTGIETSGYDEAYGYNYGGSTGDIYKQLTEDHPNIGKVHRPDAVGAEAAINRDMPFVTRDNSLQDMMRYCGYEDYLLPLDKFQDLIDRFS